MSEIVGTLWVYLIELLWWTFKNFPVILIVWGIVSIVNGVGLWKQLLDAIRGRK